MIDEKAKHEAYNLWVIKTDAGVDNCGAFEEALELYLREDAKSPAPDVVMAEIAKSLHYPQCWDTIAYPSIHDALRELSACTGCAECKSSPALPTQPQAGSEGLVEVLLKIKATAIKIYPHPSVIVDMVDI